MTSKEITIHLEHGRMTSWWILELLGTSGFFMLISPSGDVVSTRGLTVRASGPLAWSSQGWRMPVVQCLV